jgi:hypothetical protein
VLSTNSDIFALLKHAAGKTNGSPIPPETPARKGSVATLQSPRGRLAGCSSWHLRFVGLLIIIVPMVRCCLNIPNNQRAVPVIRENNYNALRRVWEKLIDRDETDYMSVDF